MLRDASRAREELAGLFSRIDLDGSGSLEVSELMRVFGDHAEGFLCFCDVNNSDEVTREEWLTGVLRDTKDWSAEEFESSYMRCIRECVSDCEASRLAAAQRQKRLPPPPPPVRKLDPSRNRKRNVHRASGAGVDNERDRERLIEFYSKYAPKKVAEVDQLLRKRPTEAARARMWAHLQEHYPDFFTSQPSRKPGSPKQMRQAMDADLSRMGDSHADGAGTDEEWSVSDGESTDPPSPLAPQALDSQLARFRARAGSQRGGGSPRSSAARHRTELERFHARAGFSKQQAQLEKFRSRAAAKVAANAITPQLQC